MRIGVSSYSFARLVYGGKMTENLLAGVVSCRVKQKLEWDSKNLRATNCPEADRFIRKQYREGWRP